uniref:TPR_REGION domain-containing protein n=1 Tax=Caenorhabditis tropicalis TaxID=1561998 RepID=A0A1I7TBD0_9PELO
MADRDSFSSRPATSSSFKKEGTPVNTVQYAMSTSDESISQFTLPNYVELPQSFQQRSTANVPKKVRGDLDLSGPELMPFLFKAADKLYSIKDKQAKAEGIKKRFYQLQAMFNQEKIADNFIRSLNYVVDSIEYENYQQAWEHYNRFVQSIPEESARNWRWLSSLKMLISELKGAQRIGSAGSHFRNPTQN